METQALEFLKSLSESFGPSRFEREPLSQAAGTARIACGKAFDDRAGAFVAAEVVRRLKHERTDHPNTVIGAATVQEEMGLRGARTSAHVVQPDIEAHEAPAKMGLGPAVLTCDASMVPNEGLKEFLIRLAEDRRIPYQLSQMKGGGQDGGAIHMANAGCPSIVLAIPTRHIHSHVAMLSVDNAVFLVVEAVKRLDEETVESFTTI